MSKKFDDWLSTQVQGDFSKIKDLHGKVKTAKKGKPKGKKQTDLTVVEDAIEHIVSAGVYPESPELDNVDFSSLV